MAHKGNKKGNHKGLPRRKIKIGHFHAILEIVGATLVVASNHDTAPNYGIDQQQEGQPRGIAPTENKNRTPRGQPRGIAPTKIKIWTNTIQISITAGLYAWKVTIIRRRDYILLPFVYKTENVCLAKSQTEKWYWTMQE